ncbi:terminase large subunit [Kingella kingae]|uniref:terminase large subunit n=1 Tax=Kingella kingae TaxID=504 RepID=UPI00254A1A75|nr:terminase large subunit [Kingella kingae]MDK4586947.1 terminase large subunit [Kingella kingae]MDK4630775.1 terminase large subunit [Kingella kingae]
MDVVKPTWTTALPDWEKRIIAGESIVPCAPLYPAMANRAVEFFARLVLRDVMGQPRIGDVTRQWVYDFVGAIFGAQNPQTYRREINSFFLLISKKNGKSTTAAAIMLTAMEMDPRESAEYLILAPTKEVADNTFIPARDMITLDPYLSVLYHIQPHTRTITNTVTGSTLKVVAADDKTVGGKKATGILIDELHLFGKVANAESMIAEATGGLLSRVDGFIIKLSTQSTEPPAGVFKAELDYARNVRDGVINQPRYMPVLYEFPKAMVDSKAYENPDNFYITNPNLGASVDTETLHAMQQAALSKGGEAITEFYAKHLNVEVGLNLRNDRWLGADFWQQTANPNITLDWLIENSEVICGGIDGGGLDDLLGLAFIGRCKHNPRRWYAWTHAWASPSVLERHKETAPRLLDFERDGDLTITKKHGEEVPQLIDFCDHVRTSGKLSQIGADPLGLGTIQDSLENAGYVAGQDLVGVSQGYKLSAAIVAAETRLAEGSLQHNGSAMMNWCVGNAKIQLSGNAQLITKQLSGKSKIDPLMALLDAVNLMSLNPESAGTMDDYLNNMIMIA